MNYHFLLQFLLYVNNVNLFKSDLRADFPDSTDLIIISFFFSVSPFLNKKMFMHDFTPLYVKIILVDLYKGKNNETFRKVFPGGFPI